MGGVTLANIAEALDCRLGGSEICSVEIFVALVGVMLEAGAC